MEYNRKVAKIYQEVNERLWNLLNKLTIVHTVDAKSVMMTKSTKIDNDDD